MDAYLFKMLAEKPVQGLVVEALGCGNVPPAVKEGIGICAEQGYSCSFGFDVFIRGV